MTDWFDARGGTWDKLWHVLEQGVADANHAARLVSLATTSPQGWPEVRKVVLRHADRAAAAVAVHTDLQSAKIASLRQTPRAALLVWDPDSALQIRMQADVSIQSGVATRALWDSIPDHAQQSYGVMPPPGTPIARALAYRKQPDPATFAVLTCNLVHIDAVHLGTDHRRVGFSQSRGWRGEWLSP